MERVAPNLPVAPVLKLPRTGLGPKDLLGVGLVAAVVLVAATSLRLYAEGPDWGLQLGQAPYGCVVALAVRGHGVAGEQRVRPGEEHEP